MCSVSLCTWSPLLSVAVPISLLFGVSLYTISISDFPFFSFCILLCPSIQASFWLTFCVFSFLLSGAAFLGPYQHLGSCYLLLLKSAPLELCLQRIHMVAHGHGSSSLHLNCLETGPSGQV